jgi:hypothetical protein
MFAFAAAIAGYGLSFQFIGIDGFSTSLLWSFYRWPWAIWFHMVFGAVALVTGALNFRHGLRRRRPAVHHRIGETYILACLLTGLAGGWLAVFAFGGMGNRLGFGGLALALLTTTTLAYRAVRARRFHAHRAWMIRSYALILAAVALRLELPLLTMLTGTFEAGYAIVAWSCWVPNLVVAEAIIRRDPAPPL